MTPIEKAINESLELLVKHIPEVKDKTGLVRTILNILVLDTQLVERMENNKMLENLERSFK
jgi:hypothetical protein